MLGGETVPLVFSWKLSTAGRRRFAAGVVGLEQNVGRNDTLAQLRMLAEVAGSWWRPMYHQGQP
jgi:hypothetical protein